MARLQLFDPAQGADNQTFGGLGTSAEIIGAVNTTVRRGNILIGKNTDVRGFVRALQKATDPACKRVVLFGADGAARGGRCGRVSASWSRADHRCEPKPR